MSEMNYIQLKWPSVHTITGPHPTALTTGHGSARAQWPRAPTLHCKHIDNKINMFYVYSLNERLINDRLTVEDH